MTSAEKTAAAINKMMEAGAASSADPPSARLTTILEAHGDALDAPVRDELAALLDATRRSEAAHEAQTRAILTLAAYVLPGE